MQTADFQPLPETVGIQLSPANHPDSAHQSSTVRSGRTTQQTIRTVHPTVHRPPRAQSGTQAPSLTLPPLLVPGAITQTHRRAFPAEPEPPYIRQQLPGSKAADVERNRSYVARGTPRPK